MEGAGARRQTHRYRLLTDMKSFGLDVTGSLELRSSTNSAVYVFIYFFVAFAHCRKMEEFEKKTAIDG